MDESDIEMAKICFCHPMHVYSAKNIIQVDHSFFLCGAGENATIDELVDFIVASQIAAKFTEQDETFNPDGGMNEVKVSLVITYRNLCKE